VPRKSTLPSNELISRWQKRRREILKLLPPELAAEYKRLGISIKAIKDEEAKVQNDHADDTELPEDLKESQPPTAETSSAFGPSSLFKPATLKPSTAFKPSPWFSSQLRTPLRLHREKLVEFLKERGPSTRGEISSATGIPTGSLSELLSGDEFEQQERGLWSLKGQAKKRPRPKGAPSTGPEPKGAPSTD
jgi:hypothetical protein